jgi:hypothetical protein
MTIADRSVVPFGQLTPADWVRSADQWIQHARNLTTNSSKALAALGAV